MTNIKAKLINAFIFSSLAMLLNVATGHAALCTPGTDCYCDKVNAPSNPFYDTALLMCEDFEAPTLRLNQSVGNGPPYYGAWSDNTGDTGDRGYNSYWFKRYGNGGENALFSSGQPASPKVGSPCTYALCVGTKVWHPTDLWDANALNPLIAIFSQTSDFSAEVGSITAPIGTANGTAGVFDGNATLGHRVAAGSFAGVFGVKYWTKVSTFGVTMAAAYASNLSTAGVAADMWKHNEWVHANGATTGDGLFLFGYAGSLSTTFPFYGFTISNGTSQATCNARVAAATVTKGTLGCDNSGNAIWSASSADYSRPTEWPLGTYACVEGYFQNIGSSNSAVQIWFTGPAGVRKKIIDFSGMDLTGHMANDGGTAGYRGFSWQAYANANQAGGMGPTTQTTFRYEDNVHVRKGAPVSCAQIGFVGGGGGDLTPPSAPSNLKIF